MNILLASPKPWGDTPLLALANKRGYLLFQWHHEQELPPVENINTVIVDLTDDYAQGLKLFFKIRATPQSRLCYHIAVITEANAKLLNQLYELGFDTIFTAHQISNDNLVGELRFVERQTQMRNRLHEAEKAVVAASAELSAQRNDMHNSLNHLRIGACTINERGNLTFLNDMAQQIFDVGDIDYLARPWPEILSFKP